MARQRLVEGAVAVALSQGIVDLSLREIAAAVGTSHRMLIYHFGSREGLLVAVVQEVEQRERQRLSDETLSVAGSRRLWQHLADPSMRPQERLFFEIYSHALLHRPGTEGFLDQVVDAWTAPVVAELRSTGVGKGDAEAIARLGLAVTRGLLLDLLATGDTTGTTAAHELFLRLLDPTPPTSKRRRAQPA